jgi:hypothetical protein
VRLGDLEEAARKKAEEVRLLAKAELNVPFGVGLVTHLPPSFGWKKSSSVLPLEGE